MEENKEAVKMEMNEAIRELTEEELEYVVGGIEIKTALTMPVIQTCESI